MLLFPYLRDISCDPRDRLTSKATSVTVYVQPLFPSDEEAELSPSLFVLSSSVSVEVFGILGFLAPSEPCFSEVDSVLLIIKTFSISISEKGFSEPRVSGFGGMKGVVMGFLDSASVFMLICLACVLYRNRIPLAIFSIWQFSGRDLLVYAVIIGVDGRLPT